MIPQDYGKWTKITSYNGISHTTPGHITPKDQVLYTWTTNGSPIYMNYKWKTLLQKSTKQAMPNITK